MMFALAAYISLCLCALPSSHALDKPIQLVVNDLKEIMEGGLGVNKFQVPTFITSIHRREINTYNA